MVEEIKTGRRQTSWLFTGIAEELNSGLPKTPPSISSGQNRTDFRTDFKSGT